MIFIELTHRAQRHTVEVRAEHIDAMTRVRSYPPHTKVVLSTGNILHVNEETSTIKRKIKTAQRPNQ